MIDIYEYISSELIVQALIKNITWRTIPALDRRAGRHRLLRPEKCSLQLLSGVYISYFEEVEKRGKSGNFDGTWGKKYHF